MRAPLEVDQRHLTYSCQTTNKCVLRNARMVIKAGSQYWRPMKLDAREAPVCAGLQLGCSETGVRELNLQVDDSEAFLNLRASGTSDPEPDS